MQTDPTPAAFSDFDLAAPLLAGLAELNFTQPTAVQALVLPAALAGQDVAGQAPTGSGKTAAYGLAALNQIDLETNGMQALVLVPTREAIEAMFGAGADTIALHPRQFAFRYRSPDHFVDVFRTWYGPTHKAFQALGPKSGALEADLRALLDAMNVASDGTLVVPSDYVEVVIRKA